MKIEQLNQAVVAELYQNCLLVDFPPAELKPLATIQTLMEQGLYECYGLYEDGDLKAYAFLAKSTSGTCVLLDYYAVCAPYRSMAYGSQFLTLLKNHCHHYKGIIAEVETIEAASDDEERAIRERRVAFYKRNGISSTGLAFDLFGVDLSIYYFALDPEWDDSFIYKELDAIYHILFTGKLYEENVHLIRGNVR